MKFKKALLFLGIFMVMASTLTSCTKSFCSVNDKAQMMLSSENITNEDGSQKVYKEYAKTAEIHASAEKQGMLVPTSKFYAYMENKIEAYAAGLDYYYSTTAPYNENLELYNHEYSRGVALFAGAETYDGTQTLWYNYDTWVKEARTDLGVEYCPDANYIALYKSTFNTLVNSKTTCISPVTQSYNGIVVEGKSWGDAWSLGLIEGLLVYPISWLLYTLTTAFAAMGGFGALLAIFIVTLIVRGVLMALTFKQTLAQGRMSVIQPEIQKLQAKYPNSQTNQYEKQKFAQEQMALYKKYKINPFGMFIILIFQFPIFIAVWSAMQGSSILMSGTIFGLALSTTTSTGLMDWSGPWYIAWIVFILMAVAQFLSMKIPQWLQKKRVGDAPKLSKNPAQDQSAKTMKWMNYIMIFMVIFMGLSLPIAMCIYWFITALISLGQSFLTHKINETMMLKHKYGKDYKKNK